jgi:2-keto-4-pentenoate hydratase
MQKKWEIAARKLVNSRIQKIPIEALSSKYSLITEVDGYEVQSLVNHLLSETLGPVVGHKIGCTTPVMQSFLGISQPCAGEIFESKAYHRAASVSRSDFVKLGVECEIVARIGRDIKPQAAQKDNFFVEDYVSEIMVGMEIVDDRYHDYASLGVPTLIADNFFDWGCVLGDGVSHWQTMHLDRIIGRTRVNGRIVGEGSGALIMGSPLNALRWFVEMRAKRSLGIEAGEFVMLGSVVETKWLGSGDEVEVEVDSLGCVTLVVD